MSTYEEAYEQERVLRKLLQRGEADADELDELERFMKRVLDPTTKTKEGKRRNSKVMIEEKIMTPRLPDEFSPDVRDFPKKQDFPIIQEKQRILAEEFIQSQYVRERELEFENHALRLELENMDRCVNHVKKLEHGSDLKFALEGYMNDKKNTPEELELVENEIKEIENECIRLVSNLKKRKKRMENAMVEYEKEKKERGKLIKELRSSIPKDVLSKMLNKK